MSDLYSLRQNNHTRAILFVHGFNGDARLSWSTFVELLRADERFAKWDLLSFGYGKRDTVRAAAASLRSQLREKLTSYVELAIVTQDIGGLIVQQALIDEAELAARVKVAVFFASPNDGIRLPSLFAALPLLSQLVTHFAPLNDLVVGNPFLVHLNQSWNAKFGQDAPFEYWTVAGDRDAVVSAVSLSAFPASRRLVVPGNHTSLIRPASTSSASYQVVADALEDKEAPASAKTAAEGIAVVEEKRKTGVSDIFLYCNHVDTEAVLELAQQLRVAKIEPWLVVERAVTGKKWEEPLMRDIEHMRAVAICIGKEGPTWRREEQAAVIGEFVRRGRSVIPVYLADCPPNAGDVIDDLKPYPVVDFRQPGTQPMEHLLEGISGHRPTHVRKAASKLDVSLKEVVEKQSRRRVVQLGVYWVSGTAVAGAAGWTAYEKYAESRPAVRHHPSRYIRGPAEQRVLVFVHGIFGDPVDTWTSSETRAYWPEMVARDSFFQGTDIYVAGYDTGIGNRMNIEELAIGLDQSMKNDDIFAKHRQVIFVCHSLGGLVLQRFLLDNRDYAKQVPRVFFYATPNEGSAVAAVSKLFSGDPLLHEMGSWEEHLRTVENDWKRAEFSTKRLCAYEKKDLNGIRVVAEASATRSCDNIPVPLNTNHIDIVKPVDQRDPSYVFLRNGWNE